MVRLKKVQVDNDQEMAQSEGNSKNRGGKKLIRYLYKKKKKKKKKKTYRKPSEQLFPSREISVTRTLLKTKTCKRFRQHKNSTPEHKTIRTTLEESPCND